MFNRVNVIGGLLFGFVLAWVYTSVLADHRGYIFPGLTQYNVGQEEFRKSGVWYWEYEQRCSADIYDAVLGSMVDVAIHYQVDTVEVPVGSNITGSWNNIATCGKDFTSACGAGFAVACVGSDYPGYPRNCDAKYDAPYMAGFYLLSSKKSVVKHEWGHCSQTRAEGYCDRGSVECPVVCTGIDSIMGCGPSPDDFSNLDDFIFAGIFYPAAMFGGSVDLNYSPGNITIWYGGTSSNATRVAVMGRAPDNSYYWAGVHGQPVSFGSIGGVVIPGTWVTLASGTCFYTNPETGVSWRAHRVDNLVGCI